MARATSKKRKPPQRPWRRRLILALKIAGVLAVLGLIALLVTVYVTRAQLPTFEQLKSSPNGQMIRVHAADGTVIVSLGPSYGEWLRYDEIPRVMREATVSVEDRRFRSHVGIDPIGVARSIKLMIDNWGSDRRIQGASTITQQVARTIFLSNRYTLSRKIKEAILALALESKFSKDQILELYMNKVYYGGGAYGIDAASRKFFGHSARQLSLAEAAVIAGLVKAPSHYSPTADAEAAIGRAGVVLKLMAETGAITPEQAAETDPASVELVPEPHQNSVRYFTDWALPQLEMLIDEDTAPLDVWTTLDLSMQRSADAAIRANVPKGAQGALVAIDRNGAVRAMVGGKDYVSSIYNRATTAVRQPGSSWKLFVYLAALEAGYRPDDVVVDEPVTIDGWSPRNDSGHFSGPMKVRTALAYSVNTIAAKLGKEVGFHTVADMARRFGITTPIDTTPAMVLGTSEVHLIDMTRAFASVANKGVAVTPFGITKVTANGATIYEHEVDRSHVLVAPYVAAEMTDLLQTAVATGTGRAAQIGRPVAGKTGTTTSNKDGWFLGFSSGLTTGVWMGKDNADRVPGLSGGHAPARAWHDFMIKAVADRPVEKFDTEVTLPEWQLEPDEESYFGAPDNGYYVDENGYPIGPGVYPPGYPGGAYPGDYPSENYPPDQRYPDGYPGGAYPPQESPYPPERAPGDTETTTPEDTRRGNLRYPPAQQQQPAQAPEQLDQDWMDRVLGRTPEPRATPTPARTPTPSRTPAGRPRTPQEARPIQ